MSFSPVPVHIGLQCNPSMHTLSGIPLRHSSVSKRHPFRIDTTNVAERVCAFLRRLHPDRTVDNVTADLHPCGIKRSTVAKMLERQTAPGAALWLALIWAYGPEFLSAAHPAPLGWLDEAARKQRQQAYDAAMEAVRRKYEGVL